MTLFIAKTKRKIAALNGVHFAGCDCDQQGEGGGQGTAAEEKRQLEREIQVSPRISCLFYSHGNPWLGLRKVTRVIKDWAAILGSSQSRRFSIPSQRVISGARK